MTKHVRRLFPLLVIVSILARSDDRSVVCRAPAGILGMDASASRAHLYLPPATSDVSKAYIYVENTPRGFYYHSNFLTPGFLIPTKIAARGLSDMALAFYNIVYTERPSQEEKRLTLERFRDSVHVILDESVFSDRGDPLVDIKGAKNISVVSREGLNDVPAGITSHVEVLERRSPPPMLMSKVSGCCLYGIPPHLASTYQASLAARPVEKSNIRFLSLIRDSGTEAAISRSSSLNASRLGNGKQIQNLGL